MVLLSEGFLPSKSPLYLFYVNQKEGNLMYSTFSRVVWGILGVLLLVCGVSCIAQPAAALLAMSALLGVAMLISGVLELVVYARCRRSMLGAGWFLLDGIIAVLLSLFLLFDQAFTALSLPFIFGMWLMFAGVSRVVNSLDLKAMGVRGWGWFTALGILLAAAGFLSFLDPISGALTLSFLLGFLFLFQGLSALLRAILPTAVPLSRPTPVL